MNTYYKRKIVNPFKVASIGLITALTVSLSAFAAGTDTWHWRNPLPAGNALSNVVYGNGLFVAVGINGTLQTSADGVAWNALPAPTTNSLSQVIFGNGRFVAVGTNGTIATSTNGTNWTPRVSGTTAILYAVAYGNSKYVAVGASGIVLVSSDAISWTQQSAGTNDLIWVAFGSGKFVVAGVHPPFGTPSYEWNLYATTPSLQTSSDGVTWTTLTLPMPAGGYSGANNYSGVYGNGRFIINFEFGINFSKFDRFTYASTDGTNWTYAFSSTQLGAFDFLFAGNNSFVEVIPGLGTYISPDGYAWAPVTLPGAWTFAGVAYGAGKYVAVGDSGQIAASTNGTNWTNISSGFYDNLSAIAAAPTGVTVALSGGDAPIYVSTNSGPFNPVSAPPFTLYGVAYGTTNFVAVGGLGELYTSTNGSVWTNRSSSSSYDLYSVCYGNGMWVGVGGYGTVITSSNTLVWALRPSTTSKGLLGVTYGNGQFVAVGQSATIITSPDGINWNPQFVDIPASLSLLSVTAGSGRFVATGQAGTIVTSTNGFDWDVQASGVVGNIYGIAFGGGQFISFANDSTSSYNDSTVILRSYDGVTWEKFRSPAYWGILGLSFAKGTFWAAGINGTVLQSDVVSTQPLLAHNPAGGSGGYSLSAYNVGSMNFRIQARTNLTSGIWADACSISNSPAIVNWTDTNSSSSSSKFYRLISP